MTQGFLMTCGGSVQSQSTPKAEMLKDRLAAFPMASSHSSVGRHTEDSAVG